MSTEHAELKRYFCANKQFNNYKGLQPLIATGYASDAGFEPVYGYIVVMHTHLCCFPLPSYTQWRRLNRARGARDPTFTNGWARGGAPPV